MDESLEVYRAINAAQERFNYFFLAASGSAIVFALGRTEGQVVACWMLPVVIAIVLWGVSFFLGSEHLLFKSKIMLINLRSLEIEKGANPTVATNSELKGPALRKLREEADKENAKSRRYGRAQYLTFLAGAVFYLLGHIQRFCQF